MSEPTGRDQRVRPVVAPTHVGDLGFPVLSAVRVNQGDNPAQFVVVADATARGGYATFWVYVWPDRVLAQDGHYDLSLDQAHQHMLCRAALLPWPTVEVVIFNPRVAEQHSVFINGKPCHDGKARTVRVVLYDVDEPADGWAAAWRAHHLVTTRLQLSPQAAHHVNTHIDHYLAARGTDQDNDPGPAR